MKLGSFGLERTRLIRLSSPVFFPFETGNEVRLSLSLDSLKVKGTKQVATTIIPNGSDISWLSMVLGRGTYLAEVVSVAPEVIIAVAPFEAIEKWDNFPQIGVDDQAAGDVQRIMSKRASISDVMSWLSGQIQISQEQNLAIVYWGDSVEYSKDAFRLVGRNVYLDVKLVNRRLNLMKIVQRKGAQKKVSGNIGLIESDIRFEDSTRMGQLTAQQIHEYRTISSSEGSYLNIWNSYNDIERESALQVARDFGSTKYNNIRFLQKNLLEIVLAEDDKSRLFLERIGRERIGLEIGDSISFSVEKSNRLKKSIIGEAEISAPGVIRFWPDQPITNRKEIPMTGFVSAAYTLDRVRVERRDDARRVIAKGMTFPARQLGLILAERKPEPQGRDRYFEPLSASVREILGGSPTEAQIEAIKLAINSRDVVVIQGPPGTGKTRVIAAIQRRLTEIYGENAAPDRRVLLASYQHDAVANLISASNDGILPAIKIGSQKGQRDEDGLASWRYQLRERLDQLYSESEDHILIRNIRVLRQRTEAYLKNASGIESSIELLEWLGGQTDLVGIETTIEAKKLARRIQQELSGGRNFRSDTKVLALARQLRSTAEGFEDDGQWMAQLALESQALKEKLDDNYRRALIRAAEGDGDPDRLAQDMKSIKESVIDKVLNARAREALIARMPEIEDLLMRAIEMARHHINLSSSPLVLAIEAFRNVVETQPKVLDKAIRNHTRALAATCQQSVSSRMRDTQVVPFDTVIIDEAARANPLDLMIPISIAGGRVILVGDHRQLPQLIDQDIAEKMSKNVDSNALDSALKESLFERLFTRLSELQFEDGVKRTITLDKQFRTHPVLGNFISSQFYRPFGEGFENGNLDLDAFEHNLPRYGTSVCGWIDVPSSSGYEQVHGSSIARKREAEAIAAEIDICLSGNTSLTFGVITFYAAQVKSIWQQFADRGLAVRDGESFLLNPSDTRLFNLDGTPRIRIGTVDAFQGREFDVVFLSTVRSNATSKGGRKYGFLMLPNRLCVAMSRQKKLLVAVGDSAMFTSDLGSKLVPALHQFHLLTGGEYGFQRSA